MRESTAREDGSRRIDDLGAAEFGDEFLFGFYQYQEFTFA
jgi:hypothetical protein